MELRFEAMLYSNLGNENSGAGHIKCSRGPHLTRGRRFPTPALMESDHYTGLCGSNPIEMR